MSAAARARIVVMLESLARHGAVKQENLIRHGANYCVQYLDFLTQGLVDFEEANSHYLAASDRLAADQSARGRSSGTYQLTPEEQQLLKASWEAMRLVQYRIESFYVFAKILLDRIADMLLITFDLARPRFGSSHFRVLARLDAGWARGWPHAEELRRQVGELKATVVDFKTEVLEHLEQFRQTRGISIGPDQQVRVSAAGMLYPEPTDTIEPLSTENLYELAARIDRYIDAVASFIEANAERSILLRPPEARAPSSGRESH